MSSASNTRSQETKAIPNKNVFEAFSRACTLTDYSLYTNLDERHKFRISTVNDDKSTTEDEKNETIRLLSKRYDYDKIISNEGIRRICEDCNEKCLATLYCEFYIDDLIRYSQLDSISPN